MTHTITVTAATKRATLDNDLALDEVATLSVVLSSGSFPAGSYVLTLYGGAELCSTDDDDSTALTVSDGVLSGVLHCGSAAMLAYFAGHGQLTRTLRLTLYEQTGKTLYASADLDVLDNYQAA